MQGRLSTVCLSACVYPQYVSERQREKRGLPLERCSSLQYEIITVAWLAFASFSTLVACLTSSSPSWKWHTYTQFIDCSSGRRRWRAQQKPTRLAHRHALSASIALWKGQGKTGWRNLINCSTTKGSLALSVISAAAAADKQHKSRLDY